MAEFGHAERVEVLWFAVALALCAALAWIGFKIEPHWVSKDGQRFLCHGQRLTLKGDPLGRWRETRVVINDGGRVQVDQKRFMRRSSTFWKVAAEAPDPPKGKAVFLLEGFDAQATPILLALRLPVDSRALPQFRPLVGR